MHMYSFFFFLSMVFMVMSGCETLNEAADVYDSTMRSFQNDSKPMGTQASVHVASTAKATTTNGNLRPHQAKTPSIPAPKPVDKVIPLPPAQSESTKNNDCGSSKYHIPDNEAPPNTVPRLIQVYADFKYTESYRLGLQMSENRALTEKERMDSLIIAGASAFLIGNPDEATRIFIMVFSITPTFRLNSEFFSDSILSTFENVRTEAAK